MVTEPLRFTVQWPLQRGWPFLRVTSLMGFHCSFSNSPLTISSALLAAVPTAFLAKQVNLPASSSNTSGMVSATRPLVKVISKSAWSLISLPSLNHLMLGSGVPDKIEIINISNAFHKQTKKHLSNSNQAQHFLYKLLLIFKLCICDHL